MAKRHSDDEWVALLQECRSSGMSDKEWCLVNNIHPSTLYRAIERLRKKACSIPAHMQICKPIHQEVVEVASIDENGIITQPLQAKEARTAEPLPSLLSNGFENPVFESTVRITTPSGIRVELSNNTNAATIRSILGVLQSV